MENISLKQISKEKSVKDYSSSNSLLVIELSDNASQEWCKAFNDIARSLKSKRFQTAICEENEIRVKYTKTGLFDEVFIQIKDIVDKANKELDDFNSWIEKKNVELAGGKS